MASKLPVPFTPVPVRPRNDGWTVERQIAFVEKLADCGSISTACKHVGMSRESLRKLRLRAEAETFREACDAALDCAYADLEESASERARNGVARPIFHRGEQVGEWRHYDERLTMFLLRFRRRHRFGVGADVPVEAPSDHPALGQEEACRFNPEEQLGGCMEVLNFEPEEAGEPSPDAGK